MRQMLAYLGLRAGVGLVGMLPKRVTRALGRIAGRLWHSFDSRRRNMARRHMRRIMGAAADAETAAALVMQSYGRYLAEALWVREKRIAGMLDETVVEGLERIIEARDKGLGMIYALPHMGNWEVAAPVSGREGVPVVAVAENLPNRRITDWFTRMRAECGIEVVLATGRLEVMRKLEQALVENKAVALPSDRDLRRTGVEVEFFGERTTLPPGPATLAIRTGAPLFPVGTYFEGDGYRVVVNEAIPIPEGIPRSDQVRVMTQTLAREFESIIGKAPEQWLVLMPNWPSDREAD
ncbi:MAG: phosphatidylinositol mannoside acyltransferase [Acidimicrobiia bacterium]|nr:phosphatidylinositol mannoside acyltransferase [Acidimicrobiia bacterium]